MGDGESGAPGPWQVKRTDEENKRLREQISFYSRQGERRAARAGRFKAERDRARERLQEVAEENERLREALREAIGWSYGDGPTPERRDELEHRASGDET